MILADWQIRERALAESIPMIEPFDPDSVQPASIDVRLGNVFRVFERDATPFIDIATPLDITKEVHVADEDYFLLHPGELTLAHTIERVRIPHDLVARVEGKSSLGRLGLFVHITAGYIDPGFEGQITLEIVSVHPLPVMLRPQHRIAQVSFHEMSAVPETPYKGRYQGDSGAVASRYGKKI